MDDLLKIFDVNTFEIFNFIENTDEETSRKKPGDGGWSILECLEHLFITEKGIYRLLNMPELFSTNPAAIHEKLEYYRNNKMKAPSFTEPRGRFSSAKEVLTAYNILRDQLRDYIENELPKAGDEKANHAIIGPMTKNQWIEFVIDHVERHLKQMNQIREGTV